MNTELIDQFIDYYWLSTGASKNTLAAYRSDLKIFNKWLAGKSFISVNSKNSKLISKIDIVNGALIGGASLKINEFNQIIRDLYVDL